MAGPDEKLLKTHYTCYKCSRLLGGKHVVLFYWAFGQYFGTTKILLPYCKVQPKKTLWLPAYLGIFVSVLAKLWVSSCHGVTYDVLDRLQSDTILSGGNKLIRQNSEQMHCYRYQCTENAKSDTPRGCYGTHRGHSRQVTSLQGRHMGVMLSQITSNSTVCSTTCVG